MTNLLNGGLMVCRWQQLLIDNFVGYDTILMNSLLHSRGKGRKTSLIFCLIVRAAPSI